MGFCSAKSLAGLINHLAKNSRFPEIFEAVIGEWRVFYVARGENSRGEGVFQPAILPQKEEIFQKASNGVFAEPHRDADDLV